MDVRADSSDRRFRSFVITFPPNEKARSTSIEEAAKEIKHLQINMSYAKLTRS